MDPRSSENFDELPSVETPEDVAVLYSWANLHGAKYRDFSASRREYRAQLRHRAAEQVREGELRAQADAEAAAFAAERSVREVEQGMSDDRRIRSEREHRQALREADEAAQHAAAERAEAARRAEAAAQAEANARREEREMAAANESARRQASLYAEAEARARRQSQPDSTDFDVPGRISDPYTPETRAHANPSPELQPSAPAPAVQLHPVKPRQEHPARLSGSAHSRPFAGEVDSDPNIRIVPEPHSPRQIHTPAPPRRPQGYRPDDASGVRQIYRPESDSAAHSVPSRSTLSSNSGRRDQQAPPPRYATRETTLGRVQASAEEERHDPDARKWTAAPTSQPHLSPDTSQLAAGASRAVPFSRDERHSQPAMGAVPTLPVLRSSDQLRTGAASRATETAGHLEDPTPKRRRQDLASYHPTDSDRAIAAYRREQAQPIAYANAPQPRVTPDARSRADQEASVRALREPEPVGPAWIYPQGTGEGSFQKEPQETAPPSIADAQESVVDTLQRSRERVASRWYALKGVFEQNGSERPETQPVRQKETRTPVLAVFSLAGGVGKTSLVATLGRSLSSLGEKVLLTDTTTHGLLPFYFGASELREGTVRTFSPPSGSTDAPIYLVNYGVDQNAGDEAAQESLVDAIATSGRGTQRIVLDLTASTGWIIRRLARLNPTILVPVAPDMNSVISLQSLEKFFHGANGADGTALKFFYVLNQFDAALPLHLDVREVLRRQLGERLLPFVIRRAPAVSEALAEGMTIVDYSPEAPVAEDFMNVATWLRAQSAPATAGFRNVRWSER